jgi:hypothetical protein
LPPRPSQIRQRLCFAPEIAQRVGRIVVRFGRGGIALRRLLKHRERIFAPRLVHQRDAQGVVGMDEIRVRPDLGAQHRFGRREIPQGKVAVPEPMADASAGRQPQCILQRCDRFLEPALKQQGGS